MDREAKLMALVEEALEQVDGWEYKFHVSWPGYYKVFFKKGENYGCDTTIDNDAVYLGNIDLVEHFVDLFKSVEMET